ncbi:acetyl-CoA carboxylase biotin carboxyl carrier protein subunit [Edaphobacter dinghuensis]|uniref:Acetyl-CoA carboxylase biotin carboxyl carrier protein subunit n=1 Tax=Edaphobacter dinghuensis TaxID=1560005 RepID=A0A917H5F3_9BACT|nr:acetyl-CoA carboxylase biotin carboxyl carrier protein subunit [Edaphobacter dinghuensis]GGG68063.1 acetyl-CoA carboxylase biotin carboxyl carrier protein subunit [Edaphobacter dinghuensis]
MTVWLEVEGKKRRVELLPVEFDGGTERAVECVVDGSAITANACMLQPGVMSLVIEGRQYRCVLDGNGVIIGGRRFAFEREDPRSLQGRRSAGGGATGPRAVKAPMPGRVVRVLVKAGDEVAEQQGVVVIEAMKMQNELKSPKAGRVARVAIAVGDAVGAGDVLAMVE